eukprot:1267219-Prymnesium_polylepis.4
MLPGPRFQSCHPRHEKPPCAMPPPQHPQQATFTVSQRRRQQSTRLPKSPPACPSRASTRRTPRRGSLPLRPLLPSLGVDSRQPPAAPLSRRRRCRHLRSAGSAALRSTTLPFRHLPRVLRSRNRRLRLHPLAAGRPLPQPLASHPSWAPLPICSIARVHEPHAADLARLASHLRLPAQSASFRTRPLGPLAARHEHGLSSRHWPTSLVTAALERRRPFCRRPLLPLLLLQQLLQRLVLIAVVARRLPPLTLGQPPRPAAAHRSLERFDPRLPRFPAQTEYQPYDTDQPVPDVAEFTAKMVAVLDEIPRHAVQVLGQNAEVRPR